MTLGPGAAEICIVNEIACMLICELDKGDLSLEVQVVHTDS